MGVEQEVFTWFARIQRGKSGETEEEEGMSKPNLSGAVAKVTHKSKLRVT